MNFSIFLNSRGRPRQLMRCIESLETNCDNPAKVEMLIRGDSDDTPTQQVFNTLFSRKTFAFNTISRERPKNLVASLNELVLRARGRFVFIVNDDAEMQTPHWDTIILDKIEQYKKAKNIKDDILYVWISDNSVDKPPGSTYSSFAIVSKQSVNTLGFFTYECFYGLGGDSSLYRIYEALDRVVMAPEINIDHVFHNALFRVLSPDITAHEMRVLSAEHPADPFAIDISKEVKKLKDFIVHYEP